ncbi:fumarylacetoacetate hydrolase family protein [Nocardioides sp. NPDC101246]|uniref:fumarylacetoacetate hydrolase family protein n=1 Tax=Nocardioides sp. NPDC101246 TaxID=3364336 RepID=UPI00381F36F5
MRLATLTTSDGSTTPVVDMGDGWRATATAVADVVAGAVPSLGDPVDVDRGRFELPYRPGTILGVGLNYHDTVADMGWDLPAEPYLFPKLSSSVTGPFDDVVVDLSLTTRADWEGELGVVIGRTARNVSRADALSHVFGYVAANDISARDLQAADGQWLRGKGLDTFCPLGPWVLTADEVPDPQDVGIRTLVDGEVVQDGHTGSMIFGVAELVAWCSRFFTLEPGDIILTGTPAGCGDFRDPPRALAPGSRVEVDLGRLGRQSNLVVAPMSGGHS